jgi:hypothetical protein
MKNIDLGTGLHLGESSCTKIRVIVDKPKTVAYYRDL